MTTRTQPITRAAREARRQLYRDLAMAQAARKELSIACGDYDRHDMCVGLSAAVGFIEKMAEKITALRKIVMDKDEEIEHIVTDTLHDAVTKIRAITAQAGPDGRIDTDELADYIGCPCGPGAPQHEHGKGGYQLAEPTGRASAEAELTRMAPAVLGDIEETIHD